MPVASPRGRLAVIRGGRHGTIEASGRRFTDKRCSIAFRCGACRPSDARYCECSDGAGAYPIIARRGSGRRATSPGQACATPSDRTPAGWRRGFSSWHLSPAGSAIECKRDRDFQLRQARCRPVDRHFPGRDRRRSAGCPRGAALSAVAIRCDRYRQDRHSGPEPGSGDCACARGRRSSGRGPCSTGRPGGAARADVSGRDALQADGKRDGS